MMIEDNGDYVILSETIFLADVEPEAFESSIFGRRLLRPANPLVALDSLPRFIVPGDYGQFETLKLQWTCKSFCHSVH